MNKNRIIALLLSLCMLACLVLAGCSNSTLSVKAVEKDPAAYLQKGLDAVMEAWGYNDDRLDTLLRGVMEKGTVELSLDMTDYQLQNTLSLDNGAVSDKLTGTVSEEPVDFALYYGNKELAVSSNMLLGTEECYGLNLDALLEQGTESNLAQLLGLDESFFDSISGVLNAQSGNSLHGILDQLQVLNQKALEHLAANAAVAEEKVTVDGAQVDAITLTVPMTAEYLNSTTKDFLKLFLGDAAIESNELISEMMDSMENTQVDGTCVWYLNKKTGAAMQRLCDMTMTEEGETTTVKTEVVYGAEQIDMAVRMDDGSEKVSMTYSHNRKVEDKTCTYTLAMDMDTVDYGTVKLNATLACSTEDGGYTLDISGSFNDESFDAQLSGTAALGDTTATLSVDSVKAGDITVDTKINVKLTAGTATVEKPAYTDLLTTDEETLTDLFYRVFLGSAYTDGFDDSYIDDTGDLADSTLCELCETNEYTQQATYMGQEWNVCDDCAEILSSDFCDMCGADTSDLTVVNLGEFEVRLCEDCYAQLQPEA